MGELTRLLDLARQGDNEARKTFFAKIHSELERLAKSQLSKHAPLTLLDPPALVREAYLRIAAQEILPGTNRNAFLSYASQAMKSIVIDYLRGRKAQYKLREVISLTTGASEPYLPETDVDLLTEALDELARIDNRAYRVVEMRFFGGMEISEVADVLNVSAPTVKRDWIRARAYLFHFVSTNGQLQVNVK